MGTASGAEQEYCRILQTLGSMDRGHLYNIIVFSDRDSFTGLLICAFFDQTDKGIQIIEADIGKGVKEIVEIGTALCGKPVIENIRCSRIFGRTAGHIDPAGKHCLYSICQHGVFETVAEFLDMRPEYQHRRTQITSCRHVFKCLLRRHMQIAAYIADGAGLLCAFHFFHSRTDIQYRFGNGLITEFIHGGCQDRHE